MRRALDDYILVFLLLVGLLIYPGTLSYYGVLLLFIIFQFFEEEGQLGFNGYVTTGIVAIFYYLSTFSTFLCICFLLSMVLFKSLGLILADTQDISSLNRGDQDEGLAFSKAVILLFAAHFLLINYSITIDHF